jgi:hypothetical protein
MARPRLLRLRTALAVALALTAFAGCEDGDRSSLGRDEPQAPAASRTAEPPTGAFTYETDIALLPFDVRLEKVARVAGLQVTDPLLDPLRARRLELGDHDFASGVKPDTSWTSSRLATWVKALRPVCASSRMRERYPALPEKLDDMVLAAYGRHATAQDRASVDQVLGGSPGDDQARYEVVCLAVLSSLEFVAR